MAQESKVYLLLGENTCGKLGEETRGTWGVAHVIRNSGGAVFELPEGPPKAKAPQVSGVTTIGSKNLLPVSNVSHTLNRDVDSNISDAGAVHFGAMSLAIKGTYAGVCMDAITDNMYASKGVKNRINFKLYFVRSQVEGKDKTKDHCWMVITGTNGYIQAVQDSFDHMNLVLSAEVWRWQHFNASMKCLRDVDSGSWDPTGESVKGHHHA